jgi:hypothetical protein
MPRSISVVVPIAFYYHIQAHDIYFGANWKKEIKEQRWEKEHYSE